MNSFKPFQAFCKRNKIKLTTDQEVMAMAIFSVFDLHPNFRNTLTGKTFLFKIIEAHLDNLPSPDFSHRVPDAKSPRNKRNRA